MSPPDVRQLHASAIHEGGAAPPDVRQQHASAKEALRKHGAAGCAAAARIGEGGAKEGVFDGCRVRAVHFADILAVAGQGPGPLVRRYVRARHTAPDATA